MTKKLIEQMLECIEELRYSNTTHAADTICDSATAAAREYLAQPEQSDAMLACDITPRPLQYPLSDYHVAMSEGPLHFTWTDKPHRLVYDLIAAVRYYAAQPQPEKSKPTKRQHDIAMSQWNRWKSYALELQAKLVQYEGGSPMHLNTAPQPEQSEQCTESDSWNCKYCRKTETCKALQDPRNFGKPKAPEPLTDGEIYTAYIEATNQTLRAQDERLALAFARAVLAAQGAKE